ncbi:hypothetical protein [Streptomyces abikoensis]|uniref:HTH cro/C1-type domain-containing protein n=1 Tax=Streptomyces abikoensis TaxID=97398 RepID=A0ABW7TCD3_9ACTN
MATRPDRSDLHRLADLIQARRVELGMHKIDVARAAELTITTYNKVEAGEPVRDVTYGKVEPVLRWATGTCRSILDGAPPTTMEPSVVPGAFYSVISPGDLEREVARAVQEAAVAVTNMPASEIRELKQRVIEELRQRGRVRSGGEAGGEAG